MEYNIYNEDSYNIYVVNNPKFKYNKIEVLYRIDANKSTIALSKLLFEYITTQTKNYTNLELSREKENLYRTYYYPTLSRVGKTIFLGLNVQFINIKYMDNIEVLENIIKLMFEILGNIKEDKDLFDKVKQKCIDDALSIDEDLMQTSILNALNTLNDPLLSLRNTGDIDTLNKISYEDLIEFYNKLNIEYKKDIFAAINGYEKKVVDIIKKYSIYKVVIDRNYEYYLDEINESKKQNIFNIKDYNQLQAVSIYKLNNLTNKERNYVMHVFNYIWGDNPSSKLFKIVREENSLCYNINSYYQKYDNILLVYTSLDKNNYDKMLDLSIKAGEEMEKGLFSIEDVKTSINAIINNLESNKTNPNIILDRLIFNVYLNLPSIEDAIKEYRSITKDDIVKVTKKIKKILNYREG